MIKQIIFEQVKAFTVKFSDVQSAEINLDTTLEKDLGISGDDGENFMWAFFHEFCVNHTGFELTKHFGPEGFSPIDLALLIRKLFTKLLLSITPIYDITIADLVMSVHRGRWIDPTL